MSRIICRSKIKRLSSHRSLEVFAVSVPRLLVYLTDYSLRIWDFSSSPSSYVALIHPWGDDVSRLNSQRSSSQESFDLLSCPVRGAMPIWPIHFIGCTNTTHVGTMCRASFPVQRSRSHGTFEKFVVSAPWFHAYLTDSFHMQHKYNTRVDDVSCNVSRSKRQREIHDMGDK